MELINN